MPRKVLLDGKVIATVPDDTTEAEEMEIIEASSMSASASTAATPPVAAAPRKLSAPITPTSPDDIRVTPKTTDRGFFGELLGSLNPAEMAGNAARTWGKAILGAVATPFLQSEDGADDGSSDPPYQAEAPQLLPDIPGIYREAKRRGESNESLAGMYGTATGQALLAGLGMGAGRLVRSAPARAAAAEADYAAALDAPPPVAREMLNRRMVVAADPSGQAATASSQAAAINAERAAIPPPAKVRGAKGKFEVNTDPAEMARGQQRAKLRAEAQLESNIASILEALPKTRTLGGAAVKGATKFATNRLNWLAYGPAAAYGVDPLSLGLISQVHLLRTISKELVKTNQWKTAAPMYRYRFMNAMLKGDADAAAATGALIANGQAGQATEK